MIQERVRAGLERARAQGRLRPSRSAQRRNPLVRGGTREGELPILLKARVREHRGGLPTITSDGHHIVGPVPGAKGFFVLSDCNVAGLSIAPALGDAVAAWITEGQPPFNLSAMSITRFGPEAQSEAWLRKNAAWR
jgi:glycine/D-amino acid oxidase-like deaminating enzyme